MSKIIYPKLSYQIVGILYDIHNNLGPAYQEKYYQRAIEKELEDNRLLYEKEKLVQLKYKGDPIGKYFLDFIIDGKIILETKTIDYFRRKDYRQVLAYLSATSIQLAILVNFNTPKLTYKRIINSKTADNE